MRVLLLEAVSAGLVDERPESSLLLPEGRAMLLALLEDLAALDDVSTTTIVHVDIASQVPAAANLNIVSVQTANEGRDAYRRLIGESDAVLVLAPETAGLLHELVQEAGEKALNCSPAAIALCSDKLQLAEHCLAHGVPTIPTRLVNWSKEVNNQHVYVIKPRDGAGCDRTFLVRGSGGWHRAQAQYAQNHSAAIQQPLCAGRPVSVAGLFHPAGIELFPVAEQDIGCGGAFGNQYHYRGGNLPARITPQQSAAVHALVRSVAATLPGLRGYVGIDVILPRESPEEPLLVEINPRLTTSYVGYRQLCDENLMTVILNHAGAAPTIVWRKRTVTFHKAGDILVLSNED
jgi:predicted ATP-grasp superfamily ATP-dependent carboligase